MSYVRCKECGGTCVRDTAWVEINTDVIISVGHDGPTDDVYCPHCETHDTILEEIDQVQPAECPRCQDHHFPHMTQS